MSTPKVFAVDYNVIRDKVVSLLGSGLGSRGYGQPVVSSPVMPGELITKKQWDDLRYDIVSIKLHQDGVTPAVVQLTEKEVIREGIAYPNSNYDTVTEQAITNRFNIGSGRSVVTSKGTKSRTGSWTRESSCEVTVTFASADQARYFFNSSGKIRFISSRTGGTVSPQNTSWTNLLNTISVQSFGASGTSPVTFYTLTTSYQTFYQMGSSSSYSSNNYQLEAKCDVADNTLGGATVVTFRIKWNDAYVDPDTLNPAYPGPETIHPPGDVVDGTLTVSIEEFKAVGDLAPSGTFTIISPTYSISDITAA